MKVGIGYDTHRFTEERPLILGGVEIPHHMGLAGHSDADVLIHAIIDALLGAARLGDIGRLFPDTESRFEGISSMELLGRTYSLLKEARISVGNIDATIMAEEPKLSGYIEEMEMNIAQALDLKKWAISVKATTSEGMGFVGRKEGIAALAVALVHIES